MNHWFTSDLHLGHAKIIELSHRPFDTIDDMNNEIIRRWNSVVAPDDKVFVLGDVAMGTIAQTLPLVQHLQGHKLLIPGNHDRCWSGAFGKHAEELPSYPGYQRWLKAYQDVGFTVLHEQMLAWWGFELCHFPYIGDSHDEDRFTDYRPADNGRWLVHGHVHSKWQVNGRQINVGVDVWDFTPVPLEKILEIIEKSGESSTAL